MNISTIGAAANKMKSDIEDKKVLLSSAIGSGAGIMCSVSMVYKLKKNMNSALKFKNITYNEKDILAIGAGSVTGGLVGGLASDKDKNNRVPKLREAAMQFFGSLLSPLIILSGANKLLEKSEIKMPEIQGSSKIIKSANVLISALPKITVTILSLIAGMNIGNKIMNKVNNKIFGQDENRKVHASDYLVHADDICIGANLLFKDAKQITTITSRLLPVSFILAGTKSGIQKTGNNSGNGSE